MRPLLLLERGGQEAGGGGQEALQPEHLLNPGWLEGSKWKERLVKELLRTRGALRMKQSI